MVRPDSTTVNAIFAAVYATPNAGVGYKFSSRTTAGVTATTTGTGTVSYPNTWMKLERVGNVITGYRSTDGVNWTSVGSNTLSTLPSTVSVGIFAAGGQYNRRTAAQFRDISYTSAGASFSRTASGKATTPKTPTGNTTTPTDPKKKGTVSLSQTLITQK
jgi:hypothetical protein